MIGGIVSKAITLALLWLPVCESFSLLTAQSISIRSRSCMTRMKASEQPSHEMKLVHNNNNNNNNNNNVHDDNEDSSIQKSGRRNVLSKLLSVSAASSVMMNGFFLSPQPAHAIVNGINKVNAKLKAFGLPPVVTVADGMTPLLEIYGKSFNRFPLLVTFNHPITWVVTVPSIDSNGEDGTIQAGEYAKGDTATLFVYDEAGHINDLHSQPKDLFEQALIKSISQKGDNMYQNFKVTKLEPVTVEDGQQYMKADFKYQLLTGAGFEVDRKGVASITSQGKAVEVLWAASTSVRYKKTEQQLRDIVSSFRCYADGITVDTL